MSTTRRVLSLLGLIAAVLIGSSLPAGATFSEAVTLGTTVGTATIAPPTQVEAKAFCTTTVDPVTGATTTSTNVKIEWWRSTSPRVTGYRITGYPAGGSSYTVAITASTDEIYVDDDAALLDPGLTISVTALVGATWTAESVTVPVQKC